MKKLLFLSTIVLTVVLFSSCGGSPRTGATKINPNNMSAREYFESLRGVPEITDIKTILSIEELGTYFVYVEQGERKYHIFIRPELNDPSIAEVIKVAWLTDDHEKVASFKGPTSHTATTPDVYNISVNDGTLSLKKNSSNIYEFHSVGKQKKLDEAARKAEERKKSKEKKKI